MDNIVTVTADEPVSKGSERNNDMENNNMDSSGWVWAFLIIALIFGGGGFFGNAGAANAGAAMAGNFATMNDVNNAIANQTNALNQQQILLSSANNNYETANLISNQNMNLMQQNNTNLINAIQGFNNLGQLITTQGNGIQQAISSLGAQMNECCCSVKTMILENRLQDTQIQLQNAQNVAVNTAQSQYLLGQMGKWVANASSAT